jgi:hypothetical protein
MCILPNVLKYNGIFIMSLKLTLMFEYHGLADKGNVIHFKYQ